MENSFGFAKQAFEFYAVAFELQRNDHLSSLEHDASLSLLLGRQ